MNLGRSTFAPLALLTTCAIAAVACGLWAIDASADADRAEQDLRDTIRLINRIRDLSGSPTVAREREMSAGDWSTVFNRSLADARLTADSMSTPKIAPLQKIGNGPLASQGVQVTLHEVSLAKAARFCRELDRSTTGVRVASIELTPARADSAADSWNAALAVSCVVSTAAPTAAVAPSHTEEP